MPDVDFKIDGVGQHTTITAHGPVAAPEKPFVGDGLEQDAGGAHDAMRTHLAKMGGLLLRIKSAAVMQ